MTSKRGRVGPPTKRGRGRPIGASPEEKRAVEIEAALAFGAGVRAIDPVLWRSKKRNVPGRIAAKVLAGMVGVDVSTVHKWRKSERYLTALTAKFLLLRMDAADQNTARRRPEAARLVPFTLQAVRDARQRDRENVRGKDKVLGNALVSIDGTQHQAPDTYFLHVRRLSEEGPALDTAPRTKYVKKVARTHTGRSLERTRLKPVTGEKGLFESVNGVRYRIITSGQGKVSAVRARQRSVTGLVRGKLVLDIRMEAEFEADLTQLPSRDLISDDDMITDGVSWD